MGKLASPSQQGCRRRLTCPSSFHSGLGYRWPLRPLFGDEIIAGPAVVADGRSRRVWNRDVFSHGNSVRRVAETHSEVKRSS